MVNKYAVIEAGTVVNIVKAEAAFAAASEWIEAPPGVSRGWTYDGSEFAAPTPPSAEELRARIAPVTMRQARLALHAAGLLASVETALAALLEPQKTASMIEWEYASEVRRDAPLIAAMTAALGLTEGQVDALFASASVL